MSTSANVSYYMVKDKNGNKVAEYHQNCMCKDIKTAGLKSHIPHKDFTLIIRWPDEDEVDQYTKEMSLADYLDGMNPVWLDDNGEPEVTYEDYVRLQRSLQYVTNILRDIVPKCEYDGCDRVATYEVIGHDNTSYYCGKHAKEMNVAHEVPDLVKANLVLIS